MTSPIPDTPEAGSSGTQGRFPILIVDDDPCFLETCFLALTFTNCVLYTATSGADALVELEKREYAAVLLDVYMQGMDGFQLARLMRANPKTKATPILFITGICQTEDDVAKGYTLGAVDYLFKPFRIVALQAKVTAFLEAFGQRKALEERQRELIQVNHRIATEIARREKAERELLLASAHLEERANLRSPERSESRPESTPGMARVCASCHKVKADDGTWLSLEEYVEQKANVTFSHGVCPGCFQRLYPGFEDLLKGEDAGGHGA